MLSLLCTHKHLSCPDRIQLHLQHPPRQLSGALCSLWARRPAESWQGGLGGLGPHLAGRVALTGPAPAASQLQGGGSAQPRALEHLAFLGCVWLGGGRAGLRFAISGVQLNHLGPPGAGSRAGQGKCESLKTTENFHILSASSRSKPSLRLPISRGPEPQAERPPLSIVQTACAAQPGRQAPPVLEPPLPGLT